MKYCTNCQKELASDAKVCPSCGEAVQEKSAPSIDDTQKIVLPPPAEMERGVFEEDRQPSRSWFQTNRRPLIIGAACVILIAILSSWFFSMQMREGEYQAKMTSVCSDLTTVHQDVLRQMNMLDEHNRTQIAEHLKKRLDTIQKIKDDHDELRAPTSLSDENSKIAQILELEERILSQIEVFCREPLTVDPKEGAQMIDEWAREADELYRSVDLDAPFDKVPSLQRAVSSIYDMMEKERQLEEKRLQQLAMRKAFIEKMDEIVTAYNAKQSALYSVLRAADDGDISRDAYRVRIAEARAERDTLRSRVRALEVPDDAELMTAKLDETLTLSLHYCEVVAAFADPLGAVLHGRDISAEANAIDSKMEETYDAFLTEFEAYKAAEAELQASEGTPAEQNTAQQ